MAFCSNCGTSIPNGARFCAGCGSTVNGNVESTEIKKEVNGNKMSMISNLEKVQKIIFGILIIASIVLVIAMLCKMPDVDKNFFFKVKNVMKDPIKYSFNPAALFVIIFTVFNISMCCYYNDYGVSTLICSIIVFALASSLVNGVITYYRGEEYYLTKSVIKEYIRTEGGGAFFTINSVRVIILLAGILNCAVVAIIRFLGKDINPTEMLLNAGKWRCPSCGIFNPGKYRICECGYSAKKKEN